MAEPAGARAGWPSRDGRGGFKTNYTVAAVDFPFGSSKGGKSEKSG